MWLLLNNPFLGSCRMQLILLGSELRPFCGALWVTVAVERVIYCKIHPSRVSIKPCERFVEAGSLPLPLNSPRICNHALEDSTFLNFFDSQLLCLCNTIIPRYWFCPCCRAHFQDYFYAGSAPEQVESSAGHWSKALWSIMSGHG